MQVVEYDGKALLSFKQKKKTVTTRSDIASASTSNPASYGSANSQKQLSLPAKAGQTSSAGTMNEGDILIYPIEFLCPLFCFSHTLVSMSF